MRDGSRAPVLKTGAFDRSAMGPFRFYCGVLPTLPLLRRPLPRGIGGLAQGIPAQGQIHQLGQPGRHFSEHAAGLGVLPKQFF